MRERFLFGLLLLLMPGLAHPAGMERMGDITIQAVIVPVGEAQHGYGEFTFLIVNTGKDTHRVSLQMPEGNYHGGDDAIRSIERSVEVKEGQSARVSLFQPPSPAISSNNVKVSIDGKAVGSLSIPAIHYRHSHRRGRYYGMKSTGPSGVGTGEPLVLYGAGVPEELIDTFRKGHHVVRRISQQPPQHQPRHNVKDRFDLPPDLSPIDAPEPSRPPMPPPGKEDMPPVIVAPGMVAQTLAFPHNAVRGDKNMSNWSSNWLGYSRYDGVVLTRRELTAMEESTRSVLWQYVESGGSLLVIGEGPVAAGWKEIPFDKVNAKAYRPGFGQCVVTPERSKPLNPEVYVLIGESWRASSAPFQFEYSAEDVNLTFPVVEDIGIPVRGLFLLMIVFGILIGPVNISMLTRWKRRLWLLWTVPVLSGLTVAAVFGYMLLAEGWSRHVRTEVVTILDENTGLANDAKLIRATTLGWTAFYSPVTPGDGLHFDYNTEATLVGDISFDDYMHGYGRRRSAVGRVCEIDWNNDQHFSRGWVTARIPSHFQVRKSEYRRERVAVRHDRDGGYTINNNLGVDITKFWFADGGGTIYSASVVEAGAEAKLTKTERKLVEKDKHIALRQVFTGDWVQAGSNLQNNPEGHLQPLSYLAELPDTPFFEDALRKAKERKCKSIVIGLLKGLDNES